MTLFKCRSKCRMPTRTKHSMVYSTSMKTHQSCSSVRESFLIRSHNSMPSTYSVAKEPRPRTSSGGITVPYPLLGDVSAHQLHDMLLFTRKPLIRGEMREMRSLHHPHDSRGDAEVQHPVAKPVQEVLRTPTGRVRRRHTTASPWVDLQHHLLRGPPSPVEQPLHEDRTRRALVERYHFVTPVVDEHVVFRTQHGRHADRSGATNDGRTPRGYGLDRTTEGTSPRRRRPEYSPGDGSTARCGGPNRASRGGETGRRHRRRRLLGDRSPDTARSRNRNRCGGGTPVSRSNIPRRQPGQDVLHLMRLAARCIEQRVRGPDVTLRSERELSYAVYPRGVDHRSHGFGDRPPPPNR